MTDMREVVVGVGAAAYLPGTEAVLDLGTLAPAAHGALRLRLAVDADGIVRAAEPMVGLLHRGAEKLFEARDYRQAMMLANRHDWLSAMSSEVGLALAVESLLGLEVPERATWSRTLLVELTRVSASLAHAGFASSTGAREAVLAHLERATGGRLHHMMTRIGGIARPLEPSWLRDLDAVCHRVGQALPGLTDSVALMPRGIAVLSRDDAIAMGVSGPVARASGLDLDLRRDDPCLAYAELVDDLDVATAEDGDARARRELLLAGIAVSLRLVRRCADRLLSLGEGPVDVVLPKVLRAPEGAAYAWIEGASGINGYYVVSTAEKTPWRCKLRTASFNNAQALAAALPGTHEEHVATALASFCFVVGDIDK